MMELQSEAGVWHRLARLAARWRDAFRIPDPVPGAARPDEATDAELARLAALSPHLLEDVGFTLDHARSLGGRSVWSDGARDLVLDDECGPYR